MSQLTSDPGSTYTSDMFFDILIHSQTSLFSKNLTYQECFDTVGSAFEVNEIKIKTPHEIIQWLRNEGIPIAVIAAIVRVERKSIYSWISNGKIKELNQNRIQEIYTLLSEGQQGTLLNLYRFWNRRTKHKISLHELFTADKLDKPIIRQVLKEEIWPLVKKYKQTAPKERERGSIKNPIIEETPEIFLPDE